MVRESRVRLRPQISGTFRVVMKPLVDEIPVVAGVIVALKGPPEVSPRPQTCAGPLQPALQLE